MGQWRVEPHLGHASSCMPLALCLKSNPPVSALEIDLRNYDSLFTPIPNVVPCINVSSLLFINVSLLAL